MQAGRRDITGLALFTYHGGEEFFYFVYDPDTILAGTYDSAFKAHANLEPILQNNGIAMLIVYSDNQEDRQEDTIEYSYAEQGYGPTLYIVAMQDCTARGKGLASDITGRTSDEASEVWRRFLIDSQDPNSNIIREERYDAPQTVCPDCDGDEEDCERCGGDGYIDGGPWLSVAYKVKRPEIDVSAEKALHQQVVDYLKQWYTESEIIVKFGSATRNFFYH